MEMDSPNLGSILYKIEVIYPTTPNITLYLPGHSLSNKSEEVKKIINYVILNTKKVKNTYF